MNESKNTQTLPWLNRSTVGITLASLFSDISHELGTAVLPSLLLLLGSGPLSIGIIEGSADALSAVAKLWGGVAADRLHRRKPLASIGYLITAVGMSLIGICSTWWQVLFCRVMAWIGRGSRSASRDVLMTEAAPSESLGKAFGMERAGDAFGAMLGPVLAFILLAARFPPPMIMIWSLLPGLLAFASITVLVKEKPAEVGPSHRSFSAHLTQTGPQFRKVLAGIFIFGCGDFSRTLLILYVTQHFLGSHFSLSSAAIGIALYALHNAVSSLAALPLGFLTDHWGRRPVLVGGYLFAALTTIGFAVLPSTLGFLFILFIGSGLYIASEEVAEKSYAAQLLRKESMGTGMGLLAAFNGVADMLSSAMVGWLWSLFPGRPDIGFIAAGCLQFLGALLIARI
jgi:MFS family permease